MEPRMTNPPPLPLPRNRRQEPDLRLVVTGRHRMSVRVNQETGSIEVEELEFGSTDLHGGRRWKWLFGAASLLMAVAVVAVQLIKSGMLDRIWS
jgi:hypothetical protein